MHAVPAERISTANDLPIQDRGRYVLYWMRAARRPFWNFSLQHAVQRAIELQRPLLIVETLACDEPCANLRHHHFALDGMADNARQFADKSVAYHPFVEQQPGQIGALLTQIGQETCLLVTDEHPLLEQRQQLSALAKALPICIEVIDGNGILPLRATDRDFTTAYSFRRFLQRQLAGHLLTMPLADPLRETRLPQLKKKPEILSKPESTFSDNLLKGQHNSLYQLPIDQQVQPVKQSGGYQAAEVLFERFLAEGLPRYVEQRNQPEREITSGLSAHLRWGHISPHQLVQRLLTQEGWTPGHLSLECRGQRSGWWGLNENSEAFLDQLITWRELGYQLCHRRDDYQQVDSLPEWAQQTLNHHADDPRPYLYSAEELAASQTHDALWNAAQRQLVREGRIHNYLRMLWGKKILEWSPSPKAALKVMIDLNDRLALDGRDPNSYSGIGWCLGRFDRAWGPERPIFGKIRYMSSLNTARKVSVKNYLRRYGPD
ncbi:deoxyribodipyrimidine photolyase [Syntrophotalea acetylenivorans]|uniref:Deoxyribodipyrimidine photo-lyase n=1 Tax=Syntrophotalea acetylenivorans TaxID=1842532 RepID=A0A1L3GQY5_9BACT|nr:deoxyribodipyrimidine photolyase [Syntrophotalea acetylenivorans]APG28359.1 deoxyribodipyrimidine photolyase [Syntrophotalea acetylenivorans]